MKRMISFGVICTLLLGGFNVNLARGEAESLSVEQGEEKLSEGLLEAFADEAESYRVMVWLEDIDYAEVEAKVEESVGYSWKEIEEAENAAFVCAAASSAALYSTAEEQNLVITADLEEVQAAVNSYISEERSIARELYEEKNIVLVEERQLADDVEYISKYAPMFIAQLTQEQIYELTGEAGVEAVYYLGEETEYEEDWQETDSGAASTQAIPVSTTYLSYMKANLAHYAGAKGDGVKVGLHDTYQVSKSDHAELANTNIVTVGSTVGDTSRGHSTFMARVICGANGVAPECELYTISYNEGGSQYAAIEQLISCDVSVINMSWGFERGNEGDYNALEKWIDHISANHSITVVVSAGNYGMDSEADYQVSSPGLAYNVITVADVNGSTDTLTWMSSYNNFDGAQKPDVAAPGTNVLDEIYGGTSTAAACVTGMVAILLEVKPSLAKYPHIIKAIVIASCDHMASNYEGNTYGSGYDNKQGAGVVNVLRAMQIISNGQYYGNYTSSNGTISYKKTVANNTETSTFVFVGTKMNTISGDHSSGYFVDYQAMPELELVVLSGNGSMKGASNMSNSSVELVRCSYSSDVIINIVVSDISSKGLPYAIAWY